MPHVDGSCLCGAVRFRIALPVKWVAHCHCSMCRRAHGAPFVTWVGCEREAFELLEGETVVGYASSPQGFRRFCGRCGSPMFFEGTRWPTEVHVARALLPDDAPVPLAQAHASWDSKAPWMAIHDDLRKIP